MTFTHILIAPRPALLDAVLDPKSDYSKQARYEMALANAAPSLLQELRLLNVAEDGSQKPNTPAGRLIAQIEASFA